ncbi:MAG: hypothetical protein C0453_04365 [Comamonadaceae bacterium]|nr:hypothetical protein [Comamonadaceae bacterium]
MLATLAPVLLFFVLTVGAMVLLARRRDHQHRLREESMRTAALARGWSFDSKSDGLQSTKRWQGTTDGTRWTLEYRHSRKTKRARHAQTHRVVWWADTFGGPSSPVLFVGVSAGQENPFHTLSTSEGVLASVARKAAGFALDKALDVHFGEEAGRQVDARLLKPVEATGLPGFMVMAADVAQAVWMLGDGWSKSLGSLVSVASGQGADRPWVLVLPRRVYLARSAPIRAEEDVQAMVRDGLALVTAGV